ncbi:uncharacterized protein [Littorina saxatilis]|uniref:Uncharacterized protein n=1 Tax=Littorina saxatilis TaxID=31220 RepID=A0AAN9GP36_9CAEN
MAESGCERELELALEDMNLEMPNGLRHVLFHTGTCRKDVYRSMWGSLMFIGKLKTGGVRTLVYPEEIREAVRRRFGDRPPQAGAYDRQYVDQGYHVSLEELVGAKWRGPPKTCKLCN